MAPLHQVIQTLFLPLFTFNTPGVGVPFILPPSPIRTFEVQMKAVRLLSFIFNIILLLDNLVMLMTFT